MEFPDKSVLLRIWALHEMNAEGRCVELLDESKTYGSNLVKSDEGTFFVILEMAPQEDFGKFQEGLERIAAELIGNMNNPFFNHILTDSYNLVKGYADLDDDVLCFNLLSDPVKLAIIKILTEGVTTKSRLLETLQTSYCFSPKNLDLLLAPLTRLDLLWSMNTAGSRDSLYLKADIYVAPFPPAGVVAKCKADAQPCSKAFKIAFTDYFAKARPFEGETLTTLTNILKQPRCYQLLVQLREGPMPLAAVADALERDEYYNYLEQIEVLQTVGGPQCDFWHICKRQHLIEAASPEQCPYCPPEPLVYLLADPQCIRFRPTYILRHLHQRFTTQQISLDQFLQHLDLLTE
jgi:hypothetical protein